MSALTYIVWKLQSSFVLQQSHLVFQNNSCVFLCFMCESNISQSCLFFSEDKITSMLNLFSLNSESGIPLATGNYIHAFERDGINTHALLCCARNPSTATDRIALEAVIMVYRLGNEFTTC